MQRVRAKLEWFKTVILPQEAALRGRLRRILPSTHELEDMVAEVLARAYATENWENVTTGRAYLFTIARNLVIDTARRNKVVSFETIADLELLGGENNIEAQLHAREALRQVSPRQSLVEARVVLDALGGAGGKIETPIAEIVHANRLGGAGEQPSFPDASYDFCASALLRASSAISAFSRATLSAREAVERSRSGPTGVLLVAAGGCAVFCLMRYRRECAVNRR